MWQATVLAVALLGEQRLMLGTDDGTSKATVAPGFQQWVGCGRSGCRCALLPGCMFAWSQVSDVSTLHRKGQVSLRRSGVAMLSMFP